MNIVLWILQAFLAFLFVAGGAYKTFKGGELSQQMRMLSLGAFRALGFIEMIGGALLVVPAFTDPKPMLVAGAAGVLALETLFLAALYGRRSMKFVAANPFPWTLFMAILAAVTALIAFRGA